MKILGESAAQPPIIREVQSTPDAIDFNSEQLVVIDNKGKLYDKKPSINLGGKTFRFFVVDSTNKLFYNGHLKRLHSFATSLDLNVYYEAKCALGEEKPFAYHYSKTLFTTDVFNKKLSFWIDQYEKENQELLTDYAQKLAELDRFLKERAAETGVELLRIRFELEGEKELQGFDIKVNVETHVADVKLPIKMILKGKLEHLPGHKVEALLQSHDKARIESDALGAAKDYLQNEVTLHELYLESDGTIKNFLKEKVNKALEQSGYSLKSLEITLIKPGNLRLISLSSPNYIPVNVQSHHEPLRVKFQVELKADLYKKANALLLPVTQTEFQDLISEQIKKSLLEKVTIEEFYNELNTTVSDLVKNEIDTQLSDYGRQVAYIHLEREITVREPKYCKVECDVVSKTKDGFKVTVTHTLHLEQERVTKSTYTALGEDDLKKWSKEQLERLTQIHFLDKEYLDIMTNFNQRELEDKMRKAAEKIGYSVTQLTSIADNEIQKLRKEGFYISLDLDDLSSKHESIKVALSVYVNGTIGDLETIRKILLSGETIEEQIRKRVEKCIRQFVHNLDPHKFYVSFHAPEKTNQVKDFSHTSVTQISTPSVSESIKAKVLEFLENNKIVNSADDVDIIVKQKDTPLIIRLKSLTRGIHSVVVSDPLGDLIYEIRFTINGLPENGWPTFVIRDFQNPEEEIEEIKKHLSSFVEDKLDTLLLTTTQQTGNYDEFLKLFAVILHEAEKDIQRQFGLSLEISIPRSRPSLSEQSIKSKLLSEQKSNDDILKTIMDEKKKRLEQLYERRNKLREEDASELGELKLVNEEIQKMEEEYLTKTKTHSRTERMGKDFFSKGRLLGYKDQTQKTDDNSENSN